MSLPVSCRRNRILPHTLDTWQPLGSLTPMNSHPKQPLYHSPSVQLDTQFRSQHVDTKYGFYPVRFLQYISRISNSILHIKRSPCLPRLRRYRLCFCNNSADTSDPISFSMVRTPWLGHSASGHEISYAPSDISNSTYAFMHCERNEIRKTDSLEIKQAILFLFRVKVLKSFIGSNYMQAKYLTCTRQLIAM